MGGWGELVGEYEKDRVKRGPTMSYLYDATSGEYLGRATDEQDAVSVARFGDGMARFGKPFLVYWEPGSRVHGHVLPDRARPSPPSRARKVCVLDTPHYYRAWFNRHRVEMQ